MGVKKRILDYVVLNSLDQPRISNNGKCLVPFDVSFDEEIIEDESIQKEISQLTLNLFPTCGNLINTIFIDNEYSKKNSEIIKKIKKPFKINYKTDIKGLNLMNYIIFIEPFLNDIDKYWQENFNASINTSKKGLIPYLKKEIGFSGSFWGKIVTNYADGITIFPLINIHPIVTLDDLKEVSPHDKWNASPEQYTTSIIQSSQDYIKQIIETQDLKVNNFIRNYKKLLEKEEIIKPEKVLI